MSEVFGARGRRFFSLLMAVLGSGATSLAFAYGPEGHLIAGRAAEAELCANARDSVEQHADGDDLGELGLWADRIRSDPAYDDAGPWHYVNIESGRRVADVEHPPEGDVLWAIGHFKARLADESLSLLERREALRFLVHFIVDIHQPLHVGLEADRGGNSIDIQFRGEASNLHRFWDSHAVELAGISIRAYTRAVTRELRAADDNVSLDPEVWAEENLELRPRVYEYGAAGREPASDYLDFAASTTRQRLVLAARRLAGTLNSIFCN